MTRRSDLVIVGGGALPESWWGVPELRTALHEAREHQVSTMRIVDAVREALGGDTSPDDTTIQGKAARILRERDAALAALDEARRERDEAREAAGSDKLHLFGELKNARAREASERTWRERAESQRDEARQELCSLLSGHLSPSDAVRAASITRATAARRGWGM